MKKMICIMVLFCLLMGITACSISKNSSQNDVVFYYCRQDLSFNNSDSVIAPEKRSQKITGSDLSGVIETYLFGPEDTTLRLLFPHDTVLTDVYLSEDTLFIILSSNCESLNEIDFLCACACLAKTVFPLTEAEKISITSTDGFTHSDGSVVFTADSLLTEDLIPAAD